MKWLSVVNIAVMSQDAILAGVDTTGTTAAFLLLDLARNPEQQEELWREVRQWRSHNNKLTNFVGVLVLGISVVELL